MMTAFQMHQVILAPDGMMPILKLDASVFGILTHLLLPKLAAFVEEVLLMTNKMASLNFLLEADKIIKSMKLSSRLEMPCKEQDAEKIASELF